MTLLSLLPSALFTAIIFLALFCESCSITRRPASLGYHVGWISSPSDMHKFPRTSIIMLSNEQPDSTGVVAVSPSALTTTMPPPPIPYREPQSACESRVNTKRLSWNLPVQSAASSPRRQSVVSMSPVASRPMSPDCLLTPEDSSQFLTAVATQERRVMELKEELAKAEADLAKLKKQWAVHEAKKKRDEVSTPPKAARPLSIPGLETLSMAADRDLERSAILGRRQTIQLKTKQPRRFEGGKHTRALSLLSPSSLNSATPSYNAANDSSQKIALAKPPEKHLVSANSPQTPAQDTKIPSAKREVHHAHGKSLVGDLREGLWTFFEDLKQATVGDEAATGARARQAFGPTIPPTTAQKGSSSFARRVASSTKQSPNSSPNLACKVSPKLEQTPKSPIVSQTDSSYYNDDWDQWDSPPPKTSSIGTAGSTPRTSMSSEGSKAKRLSAGFDQISWQALSKISPSRLSMTASNLMQDWEDSIKEPAPAAAGQIS